MQTTISRIFILLFSGCLGMLASCRKEAALYAPLPPDAYELPQGNSAYDDTIVAFKQQYGSYILYNFTNRDFAYARGSSISDTAAVPDPAYVPDAIRLLKDKCLPWYPETFRQKCMPFRIILAATIGTASNGAIVANTSGFSASAEMLGIGWTNAQLASLSAADLKKVAANLHRYFVQRAVMGGSLKIPDTFLALSAPNSASYNDANKYEKGMLEWPRNFAAGQYYIDFGAYVYAITSQTTAELNAGVLKSTVDKKGLIRQKYNIVVTFFKTEYGLDLTAIGNLP